MVIMYRHDDAAGMLACLVFLEFFIGFKVLAAIAREAMFLQSWDQVLSMHSCAVSSSCVGMQVLPVAAMSFSFHR